MSGNSFGISFDGTFYPDGAPLPAGQKVNDDQPYPVIRTAAEHSGGTELTGLYEEPASFRLVHSITVDLYAAKSCDIRGRTQQGEVFLGSHQVSVSLAESDFAFTVDPLPTGPGYDTVTATATAPDGSTSEFSPCFTIGSHPDAFTRLGVAPTGTTVAISTSSTATAAAASATAASAGKRGHGILLLSCPASADKYCRGTYELRTTGRRPRTIATGRLKIIPGYVQAVALTIAGKLLAQLEKAHKLTAELTTKAKDAAKRRNSKAYTHRLTLTYKT